MMKKLLLVALVAAVGALVWRRNQARSQEAELWAEATDRR